MVIKAKYEGGVFKPLDEVKLKEGTVADVYVSFDNAGRPAIELLAGLWADRADVPDGVTYVNNLRDTRRG